MSEDREVNGRSSIFVKYIGVPLIEIEVEDGEKVHALKERLQQKFDLDMSPKGDVSTVLKLMHNGQEMSNEKTMKDYKIEDSDWLLLLQCPVVPYTTDIVQVVEKEENPPTSEVPLNTIEGTGTGSVGLDDGLRAYRSMELLSLAIGHIDNTMRSFLSTVENNTGNTGEQTRTSNETGAAGTRNNQSETILIQDNELQQLHRDLRTVMSLNSAEGFNLMEMLSHFETGNQQQGTGDSNSELNSMRQTVNDLISQTIEPSDSRYMGANNTVSEDSSPIEVGNLDISALLRRYLRSLQIGANGQSETRQSGQRSANLEVLYQVELSQLTEMGFYDLNENLWALQQTNGSVEEAVDLLVMSFQDYPD